MRAIATSCMNYLKVLKFNNNFLTIPGHCRTVKISQSITLNNMQLPNQFCLWQLECSRSIFIYFFVCLPDIQVYMIQIYDPDMRSRYTIQIYDPYIPPRYTNQIYDPDIRSRYTIQIYKHSPLLYALQLILFNVNITS